MKRHLPALAALAASVALTVGASDKPLDFTNAVHYAETALTAKVLHASVDPEHGHYHVDVRMSDGGVHALQIEPASWDMQPRDGTPTKDPGMPLPVGLSKAARHVLKQVPGKLTLAELDVEDTKEPHYHMDVRLGNGKVAQLTVNATTGQMDWRTPAIR